jgi:hypothetical protein
MFKKLPSTFAILKESDTIRKTFHHRMELRNLSKMREQTPLKPRGL